MADKQLRCAAPPNEYSFNLRPVALIRNPRMGLRAILSRNANRAAPDYDIRGGPPRLLSKRPVGYPEQCVKMFELPCDSGEERSVKQAFLAVLLVMGSLSGPGLLAADKPAELPPPTIKVGDVAPDFTLTDQNGKKVSLHDFKGKKNVALAFYVFAFTGG